MMPIQQFQAELRRIARFTPRASAEDALTAIVDKVVQHPAFSESRLLARLLTAITYERGEFRLAEAAVFDSDTLALIVSFLDGLSAGSVSDAQCQRAVASVEAAQLTVG